MLLIKVPAKILAPEEAVAFPFAELTVTVLRVKRVLLIVPSISPAPESPSASPAAPSAAEWTVLSAITSLFSVNVPSV